MAIYKADRKENYTVVPNETLQDEELSYEAKGLLVFMLSLPQNFAIYKSWLQKKAKNCGRDKVSRLLKELELAGYLIKAEQTRKEKGKFSYNDWLVFTEKQQNIKINTVENADLPHTEKPLTGKPTSVNPQLKNKYIKKETNKKISKKVSNSRARKNSSEKKFSEKELPENQPTQAEKKAQYLEEINTMIMKMGYGEKIVQSGVEEITYWETLEQYIDWCLENNSTPRATGFLKRLDGAINLNSHTEKLKADKRVVMELRETDSAQRRIAERKHHLEPTDEKEKEEQEKRFNEMTPNQQEYLRHLRGY